MMDRLNIEVGQVWFRDFNFFKVVDIENTDGEVWVITEDLEDGEIDGDRVAYFLDEYELSSSGKPKEIIVKADKFTINDVEVDEAWIKSRIKERVGVVHPKENVLKKHNHYFKDVSDYKEIDVYALCKIFEIDDPSGCTQHAIKKLLVTGKRGHKDRLRDLQDVVDTVKRLIELESGNE